MAKDITATSSADGNGLASIVTISIKDGSTTYFECICGADSLVLKYSETDKYLIVSSGSQVILNINDSNAFAITGNNSLSDIYDTIRISYT